MKLYVGAYKGKSFISKSIKSVTWGNISHVSLIQDTGLTIESWHLGGVTESPTPWTVHTPGTEIDIYNINYPTSQVWSKISKEVGKDYDFSALLGFIPLIRKFYKNNEYKWFCSELVGYALDVNQERSRCLFNNTLPYHKVDPSYLCTSPNLSLLGTCKNMNEFKVLIKK